MDPVYEQRLRNEVIYLHALWRQGPPRPAAAAAAIPHPHLQPTKTTQFKKQKTPSAKNANPESISSPGAEWPCPASSSPPSTTAWPSPKPNSQHLPLSPQQQSKLAAKDAHHKALKAVHEFFRSDNGDDSDSVDSGSDEDDELMEDCGREEYGFFFKIFNEDAALREYYEKNFGEGEFSCLVCGAVGGKKTGKKFKGCLALVQHSITIANTKKKRAHRALGQAVCKVLGWDIDRLSTVVSLLSDKSNEPQGNAISDNVDSMKSGALEGKDKEATSEGLMNNSLNQNSADKDLENLGVMHPHNADETGSERMGNGNASSDNHESSMTFANSVDSMKNDTLEGKNKEAAPETGSAISTNSEEGDKNSLTCASDADNNLETLGQHNLEESASQGMTIAGSPKECEG